MSLSIQLSEPFAYHHEAKMFETLQKVLTQWCNVQQISTQLLGNYFVGQTHLSALWITPQQLVAFLFFDSQNNSLIKPEGATTKTAHLQQSITGHSPQKAVQLVQKYLLELQSSYPQSEDLSHQIVLLLAEYHTELTLSTNEQVSILSLTDLPTFITHNISYDKTKKENCISFFQQHLQLSSRSESLSQQHYALYSAHHLLSALIPSAHLPLKEAYALLQRVFVRAVEQKVYGHRLKFGGLFAKVDYLAKQHKVTPNLYGAINRTRDRLRHLEDYNEQELALALPYDRKSIALFIAAIYNQSEIPKELTHTFPKDDDYTITKRKRETNFVRLSVIVYHWNDEYIEVTDSQGNTRHIAYLKNWEKIRPLLSQGCRLNIIVPSICADDKTIDPELIIYEPDYLVDISAIASCFESYANSSLVYLIKKIQPSISTRHTLLGNFAGQLLDEAIRHRSLSYAESIQTFFKNNALSIATCNDLNSDFHTAAQEQHKNIQNALEALEEDVKTYNNEQLIVEPSFFCEMLGLQGRMDGLQLDFQLLIEQKSGSGAFVPGGSKDIPIHQEKHYVQLLLYLAVLHYNYNVSHEDIYAFLLYSKYKEGLLHLGNAPTLLKEALQLRNEIVAREYSYARGGLQLLEQLTPQRLNEKEISGKLWQQYIVPQLEQILSPIQQASELEKKYYFRFLTFVESEHLLSKIGNNTKENSGFAAKWHDSLSEKHQAGTIYDQLQLTILSPKGEDIADVQLLFSEDTDTDISDFRINDIVILYAYPKDKEPDARRTIVFRGSISALESDYLKIHLRHPQSNPLIFERPQHYVWAVEHDLFESSFQHLYRGIHLFLSASRSRRDLLLLQRPPRVAPAQKLSQDYGTFNDLVSRVQQAQDFFLLIGPPGTGKTSFGLLNLLKEELSHPHSSILLTAYTNRAVDEICNKLIEENLDFLRIGSTYSCDELYRPYLLSEHLEQCKSVQDVRKTIQSARIICGTTASLSANLSLFSIKHFELAIIDEASQILEPHIIGLLSAQYQNKEAISKFVLIGDHKQLPAVVQQSPYESKVNDSQLLNIGLSDCRLSLFERLLKAYRHQPEVTYMMTRQGRMHKDIATFPSRAFYQNALHIVPLAHQKLPLPSEISTNNGTEALLQTQRFTFVHAPAPQDHESDKANAIEAKMIAALVRTIYLRDPEHFDIHKTVGVIVPYRNQTSSIRKALSETGILLLSHISIDTVERYQGSQRDFIIYGFTIRQAYQLSFLASNVFEEEGQLIDRKLNVALTRARLHMILIGNAPLLMENPTFATLIDYCKQLNSYIQVSPQDFCTGNFSLPAPSLTTNEMPHLFEQSQWYSAFEKYIVTPFKTIFSTLQLSTHTQLQFLNYGRRYREQEQVVYDEQEQKITLSAHQYLLLYLYHYLPLSYQHAYCALQYYFSVFSNEINTQLQIYDIHSEIGQHAWVIADLLRNTSTHLSYYGVSAYDTSRQLARTLWDTQVQSDCSFSLQAHHLAVETDFLTASSSVHRLMIFSSSFFEQSAPQVEQWCNSWLQLWQQQQTPTIHLLIIYRENESSLLAFQSFIHQWQPFCHWESPRAIPISDNKEHEPHFFRIGCLISSSLRRQNHKETD